eukprot:Nk52_evm51s240 gene=Nk52_evmTU51s240
MLKTSNHMLKRLIGGFLKRNSLFQLSRTSSVPSSSLPLAEGFRSRFISSTSRTLSKSSSIPAVIGIRRETKGKWERRVPLTPGEVEKLCRDDKVKVIVQSSGNRAFSDGEYEKAGAMISDNLDAADVILAVKEVPIAELHKGKTYMYFSHTHKGQEYNMSMLDHILENHIRLIDYELMLDSDGVRVAKFGHYAGLAGMIDMFYGIGDRLLELGFSTPFLHSSRAKNYRDLSQAKAAFSALGRDIKENGLPKELGPFSIVVAGSGAVSQGAQEIIKLLPHKIVTAKELKDMNETKNFDNRMVYVCVLSEADHIAHKQTGEYTQEDYRANPSQYESKFSSEIAPYTSVLVNALYWEKIYPRLMTNEDVKALKTSQSGKFKFLGVADISADVEGAVECTNKCTTIDDPFVIYDPVSHSWSENPSASTDSSVVILSVDNLPAELALESSSHFSEKLAPYVKKVAFMDHTKELQFDDVSGEEKLETIKNAVIASHGQLMPNYQYIDQLKSIAACNRKNVLILGSGFVAGPIVDYLCRFEDTFVTVGSVLEDEARQLVKGKTNAAFALVDVNDDQAMNKFVSKNDLVISIIPAPFHPKVAKACIAHKKNMVTASYISPAMRALDEEVKNAGLTILNEIGLDPGIDHLSAKKIIDEVHANGGKVKSFVSWCGGLPAPEASDNPLGYKFSWSPRGVLTAGKNSALYLKDGESVNVDGKDLFASAEKVNIYPGYSLERLPNRDSMPYKQDYDIPEAETMFRGTLRFAGFSNIMLGLNSLGLLNDSPSDFVLSTPSLTWAKLMDHSLGTQYASNSDAAWKSFVRGKLESEGKVKDVEAVVDACEWLGLFTRENVDHAPSVMDAFCSLLQKKLGYGPTERDMVVLHHIFGIENADGSLERKTSTLVAYGEQGGYTAMAKTVGFPAAIASRLLLEGKVSGKGVLAPLNPEIYEPTLELLEKEGIECKETSTPVGTPIASECCA